MVIYYPYLRCPYIGWLRFVTCLRTLILTPSLTPTPITHHPSPPPSSRSRRGESEPGLRFKRSKLVNFRQKIPPPPNEGCARSQLLNIFTSADRFVFINYHRSFRPLTVPHRPSYRLLPGQLFAVKVLIFPVWIYRWYHLISARDPHV